MLKRRPIQAQGLILSVLGMLSKNIENKKAKSDPLNKIPDLDVEYKLIQQKKSKLSANQRRRVVMMVEFDMNKMELTDEKK